MNKTAGLVSTLAACMAMSVTALAGDLTPPGAPAPSMKTLTQVEPRIPIGPLTTPGDADSVYRITKAGSYYLTENLVGQVGKHGVEIVANDVTLDLMGFTLAGRAGTLTGVFSTRSNLVVRNGFVRDWDGWGIDLSNGLNCIVADIVVLNSEAGGVFLGQHGVIERCLARNNQGDGLVVSAGGLILDSTSESNAGVGIAAGNGTVVRSSRADSGLSFGILSVGGVVEGCVATSNIDDGVRALGSVVRNTYAFGNAANGINAAEDSSVLDCSANSNGGYGIVVDDRCIVMRNQCSLNGSISAGTGGGILATGIRNRIEGNAVMRGAVGFDIDGSDNFLARNTSLGATTNYDISAGNICLVVTALTSGAFAGDAGGVSPGSADPNANYAR